MKSFLFVILALFFYQLSGNVTNAGFFNTEPQQIKPISKVLHEKAYYLKQVDLWKLKLESDDKNSNAWLNYYLACRIVNMLTPETNPHDLNEVRQEFETKILGTYEYEYLVYLNGGGDPSLFHHLERAYELDPNRVETYSHMINHHLKAGNKEMFSMFCKKWLESGEISPGILNWNYNALIGLDQNAILLTYGDNDTYPSWMLQEVNNVRPDISVINVHLLRNKKYCDNSFKEIGIPNFQMDEDAEMIWETDMIPVVDHLMQHANRPLYLNVTIPKSVRESYKDVLYTVGLAFRFSTTTFDNVSILKKNYEQKFLTDYLKVGFTSDKSASVLNSLNISYLPAFVTLYKHYIDMGDIDKAEDVKMVLLNIGRANDKEEHILTVIAGPRKWNQKLKTHMDIKNLDKHMKEVQPGLCAAATETTNLEYEAFLMDLLKHKEFELLDICKTTKVDWLSLVPSKFKHLTEDEIYRNDIRPDHADVPISNISYEAAVIYCEWLTLAYNAYDKKKKHQEVLFRLPTEDEWINAARGNHKDAPYPWGGYYFQNAKGCFLSNFDSSDEPPCTDCKWKTPDNDGSFFPVNGDAYFPNDKGLYGMSGNVAEMLHEGKIAKGGSWEDKPTECTIDDIKVVDGISPAIGFRVFMEIIK